MAKSLSSILSQIERLQKEAAAIQSEVVSRIQKDITKFGLTAEQLFGMSSSGGTRKSRYASNAGKAKSGSPRVAKYTDGAGNSWGGMGKRPDWLRQALEAGKALQDFLVAPLTAASPPAAPPAKRKPRAAKPATAKPATAKSATAKAPSAKRAAPKKTAAAKPRAKPRANVTGN